MSAGALLTSRAFALRRSLHAGFYACGARKEGEVRQHKATCTLSLPRLDEIHDATPIATAARTAGALRKFGSVI